MTSEEGSAKILLSADYQGRVMTSTVERTVRKLVRLRIFKTFMQHPKYTCGSPVQIENIWKEKKSQWSRFRLREKNLFYLKK